jgi:membrane protease YdiL (CAAX protease family)
MSFENALNLRQLPEKPWKVGAVVRFGVGVLTSMALLGGLAALVIRYFETPQNSSVILFIMCVVGAFAGVMWALVMLSRPWLVEERFLFNLIVLLGCIYGAILLIWLAGRLIEGKIELQNPVETMFIAVVFFQGTALVLVHFFLREHLMNWREGFGLNLQPGRAWVAGVWVGILITYPILWLNGISFQLFERLALHPQQQHAVEILRHTQGMLARVISGIATVVIAPIGEEVMFRGILYPTFKRRYGGQIALWGTALLFGVIHFNLSSFLPLALLSVILVFLYEYTGNLLAPIAVHCVFNAANFVALFYQQN